MNRPILTLLSCASLLAACSNQPDEVVNEVVSPTEEQFEVEAPAAAPGQLTGPVLETMDAGGYTYVLLDTSDGEVWAAGPKTQVEIGTTVEIANPMPMPGFESASLGREFDMIYFASAIVEPGGGELRPTGTPAAPAETGVASGDVPRAEGGQTVEQVINGKDEFVGQEILVRAKVVKFTPQILGKNWLHIQDGTGSTGTNDLTVTTDAMAAVGDQVLVRGVLAADKDFGYGYKYDLIVEDAQVTIE